MDNNMLAGIGRAIFPPIFAFLVGKGTLPAGDYGSVVTALVALATAIWSIHSNMPQKAA